MDYDRYTFVFVSKYKQEFPHKMQYVLYSRVSGDFDIIT